MIQSRSRLLRLPTYLTIHIYLCRYSKYRYWNLVSDLELFLSYFTWLGQLIFLPVISSNRHGKIGYARIMTVTYHFVISRLVRSSHFCSLYYYEGFVCELNNKAGFPDKEYGIGSIDHLEKSYGNSMKTNNGYKRSLYVVVFRLSEFCWWSCVLIHVNSMIVLN